MATDPSPRTLEATTRELLDTLREIERAVEPPDPGRLIQPPTPRGFLEFTSEVGIPAAILVLRTNIAVLELLQRSLRMMGDRADRGPSGGESDGDRPRVRRRAADLTATSLGRLDDALSDLQSAVDGRSIDRSPEELLAEARRQTEELEAQLEAPGESNRAEDLDDELDRAGGASVDVEAELDSLRESVDRSDDTDGSQDSSDA